MNDARKHKPFLGISLFILSGFLVTTMNMFVKLVADTYSPIEIVFYRGLFVLVVMLAFIIGTGKFSLIKTQNTSLHIQRSLTGTLGVLLVFWSFQLLPMTEATALHLLSGLIITALSAVFLKENVGIYKWSAVLMGFVGALIILNPSAETLLTAKSIVPILAAFSIAGVYLYIRAMAKSEPPFATIFYFMVFSVLVCGAYVAIMIGLRYETTAFLFLIGVATFALSQQFAKTYASVFAEASTLSPYAYFILVWAALFDIAIWNVIPASNVIIGSLIIIISNLIIIWQEKRKKKVAS